MLCLLVLTVVAAERAAAIRASRISEVHDVSVMLGGLLFAVVVHFCVKLSTFMSKDNDNYIMLLGCSCMQMAFCTRARSCHSSGGGLATFGGPVLTLSEAGLRVDARVKIDFGPAIGPEHGVRSIHGICTKCVRTSKASDHVSSVKRRTAGWMELQWFSSADENRHEKNGFIRTEAGRSTLNAVKTITSMIGSQRCMHAADYS